MTLLRVLSGRKFRPRLLPTLVAAAFFALGIAAGRWQTARAEQKIALRQTLQAAQAQPALPITGRPADPEALRWHKITASGTWIASATIYLDNRVQDGVPGYQVLTPLDTGETKLLVNRGWVAAPRTRDRLPSVVTPAGAVVVEGEARVPLKNAFALGVNQSPDGRVWQRLDLAAISKTLNLPLQGVVLFQQNETGDGLVRLWDAPDYGIATHRGYAFQWYALAALAFIFFLVLSFRRSTDEK